MAGLQGVGKTTACGKLALALQKRKKRVLMVATDVYRPAAIDQLVKLGERIKVAAPHHAPAGLLAMVEGILRLAQIAWVIRAPLPATTRAGLPNMVMGVSEHCRWKR